jgi:hypothetical protein
MALDLDFTSLRSPIKIHDNCTVLDVGSGSFPRYIEVRPPGADGARITALWDGSLNLAVNDKVICHEYPGSPVWRISSMGGDDSGAGKVRVSSIWESDFGAVALEADADGNLTLNGSRTLTIPGDLIHGGDTDTKISLTDDDVEIFAGNLSMLKLTETTQDVIRLGPGSGDVDINFNGDMFIRGSDGYVGIGINPPEYPLHLASGSNLPAVFEQTLGVNAACGIFYNSGTTPPYAGGFYQAADDSANNLALYSFIAAVPTSRTAGSYAGDLTFWTAFNASRSEKMRITSSGDMAIGLTSPQGRMHAYDTISGFLLWEYNGLDATVRTIVPNGTGDCLYRLHAAYVLRDSTGAVASGTTDVSNGASVNLTVGANTVRLRVNADGSVDIARTAGSNTIKVALTLRWL